MRARVGVSSNVARGAVYALASKIPTIQQYLDEGAGFGLLKKYQEEGETEFYVPKLLLKKVRYLFILFLVRRRLIR